MAYRRRRSARGRARSSRRTYSGRRSRPVRRARRSYSRSGSRRRSSSRGRTLRIVFEQPGGVGGIGRVAPGMLDAAGVVRQSAGSPKKAKF
jgi:hypothetical protein